MTRRTKKSIIHTTWQQLVKTICLVMMLVAASASRAQEYTFRSYGINDGLPYLRVNCIIQDNRGFMWFGTDLGLACFDGVRFRTNIPFNSITQGLHSTTITSLYQDAEGLLWIGTTQGLYAYDIGADHLQLTKPNGWAINGVTSLTQDADGAIWAITPDAFYRLDFHHNEFQQFICKQHFIPTSLVTTHSGMLWLLATDGCIYQYIPAKGTFAPYRVTPKEADDRARILFKGIEREDGKILITTIKGGVRLFSPTTKKVETLFTSYGDDSSVITHTMMKRSDGEYWFGTEKGIYVWIEDGPNAGMTHLQRDPTDSHSLSDNAIHDLCQDNEGGVWVATAFGGVNYMASGYSAFQHISLADAQLHAESNVVRSIISDGKGALWIGAEDGGLYHYDPQTDNMRSLSYLTWQGKSLAPNIQSLLLLGDNLWIGHFDGSIYVYDTKADRITHRYVLPYSFPVDMLATQSGHIYLATTISLLECQDPGNSDSCLFKPVEGVQKGFMHHIYEDHEGNLWVASLGAGVWRQKAGRTAKDRRWEKLAFPDDYMCSVFEDSRGVVWVGSLHNGLYYYDTADRKGKAMQNILNQASLGIYRIVEDNRGVLWLSSSNGLYSYDRTTDNVIRYGLSPILSSPQFNFNSGYLDNTGRIYFGSLDGILAFSPEMVEKPEVDLTVYFVDYINEGTSFGVSFSVPLYSIQETPWFRYRLKGVDKDWTVVQGQRNIRYNNLAYGRYALEVEASLQNGKWTGNVSTLDVEIVAPWYASTPIKWVYAIVLSFAAIIIYKRYRRHRLSKQQAEAERQRIEHEKQLGQEKVKFFTAITHEIRTPLTLIITPVKSLINAFSAEKAQLMLPTIYRNANELLNLVNQILDYRRLEQGRTKLDLSHGDFNEFCRTVMDLFSEMASKKHIDFTTNITQPLYMNFDKEKMQRIVTNLLSNAFKFTPENGRIRLEVHETNHQCELSVSDNGIGIGPKDLPHVFELFYQSENNKDAGLENQVSVGSGIGLHLVREFVTMHNGQITVESNNDPQAGPTGTTFTVILPTDLNMATSRDTDSKHHATRTDDDSLSATGDEPTPPADHKPVVLLVDDNEELRQYLYLELCDEYDILQAGDGQEALDLALEHEIDIVVSDVMMPTMDGMELCRQLKSNVRTSHLFVVLLTAKTGEQYRLSGYKSGADYYIAKPFNIEILRNRIAYLNSLRQQRHDMFLSDIDIAPKDLTNSRLDEELYNKAVQFVNDNMGNEDYSVEQFASDMCMSRMTLYRKIQSITGQKPLEFIRAIRLKKAASLLLTTNYSVVEIAEMVGYSTSRNFSKNFKAIFGMNPSDYKSKRPTATSPRQGIEAITPEQTEHV